MTAFAIFLVVAEFFRGEITLQSYFVALVVNLLQCVLICFKFVEFLPAGASKVVSELVHGDSVVFFVIPDRPCQVVDEVGLPVKMRSAVRVPTKSPITASIFCPLPNFIDFEEHIIQIPVVNR